MKRIKVDCHTHTHVSFDGSITPERYIRYATRAGLDAVIICDHNSLEGAMAVKEMKPPFKVVVSEEILTSQGELIGAFLQEPIKRNMPYSWTLDAVHEQGGIAIVPHPFVKIVITKVTRTAIYNNIGKIDAIEVINGRNENLSDETAALRFAKAHKIATCAGSDAHLASSLGNAYMLMEPFDDSRGFLKSLRKGTMVCESRTSTFISGVTFIPHAIKGMIKGMGKSRQKMGQGSR